MFQPLGSLFTRSTPSALPEHDLRYAVQTYLQQQLGTDMVVCQGVQRGAAHVRVGTPALYEAVRLLEYDVRRFLRDQAQYKLRKLMVVMG